MHIVFFFKLKEDATVLRKERNSPLYVLPLLPGISLTTPSPREKRHFSPGAATGSAKRTPPSSFHAMG